MEPLKERQVFWKRIDAMIMQAKETGLKADQLPCARKNAPNWLAENIKTAEQARTFMILLEAYRKTSPDKFEE